MKRTKVLIITGTILGAGALASFVIAQQTQPAGAQTQPAQPAAAAPSAPQVVEAFNPARSDEKAIAIVDEVIKASGGADQWGKTRYMKFTFVVKQGDKRSSVRTHYWDKFEQRSRLEGSSRDGKALVALSDHKTKAGQATLDGQLLFDADAKKYTDLAYGTLINDSYWLVMQFKLKDPGVRLRHDGEVKVGPVTYDKILVSFDDGIGLTSKDRYWLYVNRDTHVVEKWSFVLTGEAAGTAPRAFAWEDYNTIGGLKLSLRKTQDGGENPAAIVLENVQVFDTLPDSVFTSTSAVQLTAN